MGTIAITCNKWTFLLLGLIFVTVCSRNAIAQKGLAFLITFAKNSAHPTLKFLFRVSMFDTIKSIQVSSN